MSVHVFGIRHHGPGSARSLCQALETLEPDIVLVEGPPEAEALLPLLLHPQMRPPVAILIYSPDQPEQAVYYPFAVFSPEWQALRYGLQRQLPVRFMDLPQSHRFGLRQQDTEQDSPARDGPTDPDNESPSSPNFRQDPLRLLAQAAGYSDGERWWEHLVEQRQDSTELFAAILTAMSVLRAEIETLPSADFHSRLEACREAYMRKTIREAEKQGFEKIAVVCGAWHAPALVEMPPAKQDTAILKGLPRLKVEATWVPWTYGHLLMSNGYGAGIESPGWYQHLWDTGGIDSQAARSIRWMVRVAQLLRSQDLDASSASLIEAVRLAETLAALRELPLPGLPELNEAIQTGLCFGDPLPMQLIHDQLIVSERLGRVPEETPMVPLQQDLQRQQKHLRLKPSATETALELDLRKPLDLERSHLLHRLVLLELPWGIPQGSGSTRGTFREIWRLQWQPEFSLQLIEAGAWGNTIELAATACICDRAERANLPILTQLIDDTLLANLPPAITHLMARLEAEAALASDITHLMAALPPLVNVIRYGTVRQLETQMVGQVVDGLITRICIGLPVAAASLNDEAAAELYQHLIAVHAAIGLLQQPAALELWQRVLGQLADQQGLHGLVAGRCCRLLFEAGVFQASDTARRLSLALSTATEPTRAGHWIEGFLTGSGLLLLHNPALWQVLDHWLMQLSADTFTTVLPLLRRTFATFPAPERRQMGERVRQEGPGEAGIGGTQQATGFDPERAAAILPLITQLLGLQPIS